VPPSIVARGSVADGRRLARAASACHARAPGSVSVVTADDETPDEAPSGLPPDGPEAPPMGVPADPERDEDADPELPGIPDEDSPPSTG
jgi:hypothetical protein